MALIVLRILSISEAKIITRLDLRELWQKTVEMNKSGLL